MSLRAFVSAERGRCAQLARAIKVHPVLVSQWAGGKREVPIEHCAAIEIATEGAVTRQHLRPHDWGRIWPELLDRVQGAAAAANDVPASRMTEAGHAD